MHTTSFEIVNGAARSSGDARPSSGEVEEVFRGTPSFDSCGSLG
jgi:hypothetical protein